MSSPTESVTIDGTPVPIHIRVLTPRLLRIRLGERSENSPASYLSPRDWEPVAVKRTAGRPAGIDTGELTVEIHRDPWRLSLGDRSGAVRMQVPLDAVGLGS